MRIVDVCAHYSPKGGGVRTYIRQKLVAAPRLGHELIVIAPGKEARTEHYGPGARIEFLAGPKMPVDRNYHFFPNDGSLHRALDRLEPDFVEVASPWRSPALVAQWRGAAPRALVMHSEPLAAFAYRWFEDVASRPMIDRGFAQYWRHLRALDRAMDVVVSASASLTRRMRAGGLTNLVTVPMGVGASGFSPSLRDPALRQALLAEVGLGPEATLLIGVGRLSAEKRWPMVVSAVAQAGLARKVGLVIVGEGPRHKQLARELGGNPHVRLLGRVEDRTLLARMLASADALAHGGEAETFSIVAAEARASGLPLIVPDEGGAGDQLVEGAGERFAAGDAASMRAAIIRLHDRRAAALAAARAAAARVRTMDDHFAELFALYERIGAERRLAA